MLSGAFMFWGYFSFLVIDEKVDYRYEKQKLYIRRVMKYESKKENNKKGYELCVGSCDGV